MQACNDGVESIAAALGIQKVAIAEEAKRKAEEQEERCCQEQQRIEESHALADRLKALGYDVDISGKQPDPESESDADDVIHNPVCFTSFHFIHY
jgi:hypothetical protein